MKIIGAGGHARVVAELAAECGYEIEGFLGLEDCDLEIEGVRIPSVVDTPMLLAVGDNRRRRIIGENLKAEYPVVLSRRSYISPTALVGEGSVLMPLAAVQCGVKIGRHCIINTGAVVEHDCRIGDYSHISPNATLCGGVETGENVWVGAGATVLPGVKIGKGAVIGAGAVVVHDVAEGVTAKGVV
ncbi:MAG: acetyltransferase [Muribaculaceae bacterium]|nr:acetyltransferase [Muribaculaceae bacterium]